MNITFKYSTINRRYNSRKTEIFCTTHRTSQRPKGKNGLMRNQKSTRTSQSSRKDNAEYQTESNKERYRDQKTEATRSLRKNTKNP